MLVLFITFSNHFSRKELIKILEIRISALKTSLENIKEQSSESYMSKFYNQSLKATSSLIHSELKTLEEFLSYAQENEKWNDFLVL